MPTQAVLEQKQALVASLTERLQGAKAGVVVSYQGISVADDTELRRKLREAGVEYSVVKNTLLGRAAEQAGLEDMKEVLEGSTALATCADDELAAAKVLCEFADAKKDSSFAIKIGFSDGKVISADTVKELSKVPAKEVLLGMLAGGLNATIAGLARALNAVAEQNGGEAAEAPAEA